MRLRLPIFALFLAALLSACGEDEGVLRSSCGSDSECASGFCYAAMCLEETGDPDGDGLTSAEERAVGTHPLDPDTDDDGLDDLRETGDVAAPNDSDGDGRPDALESLTADRDADCVPDPWDPADDDTALPGEETLQRLFCRDEGVCGADGAGGRVYCNAGSPRCDYRAVPGWEADEQTCDGRDNDCDGRTDEGFLLEGAVIGAACPPLGACGAGIVECAADGTSAICSTRAGGSAADTTSEQCDLLDNDCDGLTDEDVTAPDGSALGEPCNGPGACGLGEWECAPGRGEPVCSTAPGASADQSASEQCDGLDNDCDGLTDEDLIRPADGHCATSGPCGAPGLEVVRRCEAGEWVCDYGDGAGIELPDERSCDGVDNDCDGLTDEPFTYVGFDAVPRRVGAPCGTGACAGGVVACTADGLAATCPADAASEPERCDDVDNDCDGLTDEELLYQGKALGQTCDGIGACGPGLVECSPETSLPTCSTNPDGRTPDAAQETCDDQDNDCDGATDEELSPPLYVCDAPGVCAGNAAVADCVAGEWLCDYASVPGWEPDDEATCDDLDNDCDGYVDEGFARRFGGRWETRLAASPPARSEAASAALPGGRLVFVFGGLVGGPDEGSRSPYLDDVWSFDVVGDAWAQVLPSGEKPPPTAGACLVSDPAAGRLLLIGGRQETDGGPPTLTAAVWAFSTADGTWSRLETTAQPAGRAGHAAALDPTSREVWVYGSATIDASGELLSLDLDNDSWRVADFDVPAVREPSLALAEDTRTLVVFGGRDRAGVPSARTLIVSLGREGYDDAVASFEPDGQSGPSARWGHAMWWDEPRGRVLLHGGFDDTGAPLADTWAFDLSDSAWSPVPAPFPPPAAGRVQLIDSEAGLLRLGGELADGQLAREIWRFDPARDTWSRLGDALKPPPLRGAAAALDRATRRWLVFGGLTPTVGGEMSVDSLWAVELDSGQWTRPDEVARVRPDPRSDSVAVLDYARGRLLVHGGAVDGAEPSGDVWAFHLDSGLWSQLPDAGAPALAAHSALLEPGTDTVHVFGGRTAGDTATAAQWLWDIGAQTWTPVEPSSVPPPALSGHTALWDDMARRIVVVGGTGGGGQVLLYAPTTAAWSVLTTIPELASSKPVAWLDSLTGELLVGTWQANDTTPLLLSIRDGVPGPIAFDGPIPTALRDGAALFDPATRRAYLFGGRGALAPARDGFWSLGQLCE